MGANVEARNEYDRPIIIGAARMGHSLIVQVKFASTTPMFIAGGGGGYPFQRYDL